MSGDPDRSGRRRKTAARAGAFDPAGTEWLFETLVEGGILRRIPIRPLPFRVGRRQGLELVLPSEAVSKVHAEIYASPTGLRLRDLGSRNGTFVNRTLVEDTAVREGDIVHFADFEVRLARPDGQAARKEADTKEQPTSEIMLRELPRHFVEGTRELKELLRDGVVTAAFQPIARLPDGAVAAYEVLGRGRHPQLPESPLELFRIAESMGAEAELSRLLRRRSVELAAPRNDLPTLFLNTHPIELARPGLLESLEELRLLAPHLDLALEIHESVLTRPAAIAELRALLLERNIALAYDDFGTGQARLLELAEAPPHYLKFDRRFVSGIDHAPLPKRRLLQSLLALARDLHVKTVAEGVETAAEGRACAEIGFTHAQGFLFGRPRPIDQI